MKKNILILGLLVIALIFVAVGVFDQNDSSKDLAETMTSDASEIEEEIADNLTEKADPNLIFDVSSRFNSISKEDLENLRTFDDIIGHEHANRIVSYKSLSVIVLDDSEQTDIKISGKTGVFTDEQLKFLKSTDYSTNLLIWADYIENNKETGNLEHNTWTPYLTIVPEVQAEYMSGKSALLKHLRKGELEFTRELDDDILKPGVLYFTVTKNGDISNVKVKGTSGYPEIDNTMTELILNTSGKWKPAENTKGERVDQELVLSFGKRGC